MKVVVQRVKYAQVSVNNEVINDINQGLLLFVGFTQNDTFKEINYMVNKICHLRIFDDELGVMNKSLIDINGSILSISQFTLYADSKKGNRPSYIKALNGMDAKLLYDEFNKELNKVIMTKTGVFGADMQINLQNDGPVTIILEN